jgi:cell division protein FtsN
MQKQSGGTFLGFVLGLVVGLGIAMGVAFYVTKVPLPFMNKGQTRGADQNDAEAKKNKDWDPNALISGKPSTKAAAPETPTDTAATPNEPVPVAPATIPAPLPVPAPATAAADPIGALATAKAGTTGLGQTNYFVQTGAFRSVDDAQGQRAKLSLSGVEALVLEREQSGRPIYKVRVGPFEKIDDAERAKEKLDKSGMDTVLVKVQR